MMEYPAAPVLLIDRDLAFGYLIARYVERSGHRFVRSDGATAFRAATLFRPALIIIGMRTPTSRVLLRQLRTDGRTHAIPLVLCSAFVNQERAWHEGVIVCLPKPVMYSDFLAALAAAGIPVPAES
jgi:CheY-like chemotaxis protein